MSGVDVRRDGSKGDCWSVVGIVAGGKVDLRRGLMLVSVAGIGIGVGVAVDGRVVREGGMGVVMGVRFGGEVCGSWDLIFHSCLILANFFFSSSFRRFATRLGVDVRGIATRIGEGVAFSSRRNRPSRNQGVGG